MKRSLSLLALLLGVFGSASAHIVLDVQSADAGSYYRGALRVGHGCSGSPVKQVIVQVPTGVQGAKPMPKAGWRVETRRAPLAQSYVSHGRTVTEDVVEIRWTAKTQDDFLPDDQYDEFVVFAKLPDTPGKLYWKTTQMCEAGQIDWHELPAADGKKLKAPAAVLEIKAKPAMQGHHSH